MCMKGGHDAPSIHLRNQPFSIGLGLHPLNYPGDKVVFESPFDDLV